MTLETIDQLMQMWEHERLTTEQIIGRILRLLQAHHVRLLKLEASPSSPPPPPRPPRPKKR